MSTQTIPRSYGQAIADDIAAAMASATPAAGSILRSMMSQTGEVTPASVGVTVLNGTGGDLAAGILVYLSGFDATSGLPKIVAADQSASGSLALWILSAAIANGATGVVVKQYTITGVNTNAGSVGDDVWLGVSGGWTLTQPTGADRTAQLIGTVAVKSASVGQVLINLDDAQVVTIGVNQLLAQAVQGVKMSLDGRIKVVQVALGTLATAGDEEVIVLAPVAGTLTGVTLSGKDALTANDTNFQAFLLTNKGQAGGGSTAMLSATAGAASTKATGGQALVAYGKCVIPLNATGGNLVVAKGDTLVFTVTHNGTPANTVTECVLSLEFSFTT